jgi:phosphatidylinositol alpha-1,6-mannosyltransferase
MNVLVLTPTKIDRNESFTIRERPHTHFPLLDYLLSFCFLTIAFLRFRPHWVIAPEIGAQRVASILHLFIPFRFLVVLHGYDILVSTESSSLRRIIFRLITSCARPIVAVSRYVKGLLLMSGIPEEKIAIINGGVNIERFSKGDPERLKKRFGLKNKKIILALARLDKVKGQDIVIKVLPRVIQSVPDVRYIIAGKGKEEKRLKRLVDENSLNQYVIFAGYVKEEELADFYMLCDIFVMLSHQAGKGVEGFGLAFLEANMCGKPVIGGRHGGVLDAVIDGETGILVNPEDEEEIAGAIVELLKDKELSSKLGKRGRERCISQFSWKMVAGRFLEVMNESAFYHYT